MSPINGPAVLVAFVLLQGLGFAWYHEALFGTAWMQDVGFDPKEVDAPPAWVWIVMMIATFLKISLLAIILRGLAVGSARGGGAWGALLGFGLLAMTLASHHAFAMQPVRQILIEGSQEVVGYAIAGALLAAWPTGKAEK